MPKVLRKKRLVIGDLLDLRRLAEFMGWAWEDETVVESYWGGGYK